MLFILYLNQAKPFPACCLMWNQVEIITFVARTSHVLHRTRRQSNILFLSLYFFRSSLPLPLPRNDEHGNWGRLSVDSVDNSEQLNRLLMRYPFMRINALIFECQQLLKFCSVAWRTQYLFYVHDTRLRRFTTLCQSENNVFQLSFLCQRGEMRTFYCLFVLRRMHCAIDLVSPSLAGGFHLVRYGRAVHLQWWFNK